MDDAAPDAVEHLSILRYSPHTKVKQPLLQLNDTGTIIAKGVTQCRVSCTSLGGLDAVTTNPPMRIINADWITAANTRDQFPLQHDVASNVFGDCGIFNAHDALAVPTVMASPESIAYYGLQLVKEKEYLRIESHDVETRMVQCNFAPNYQRDYLFQELGGGGFFLETHNFPHIHIPLSPNSGGVIVIGKKLTLSRFALTAFQIPFGFALYTPAHTIHGDGLLVGDYALSMALPKDTTADTVLVFDSHSNSMAKQILDN